MKKRHRETETETEIRVSSAISAQRTARIHRRTEKEIRVPPYDTCTETHTRTRTEKRIHGYAIPQQSAWREGARGPRSHQASAESREGQESSVRLL